ncbi:trehalose-phosphatase [Phyllobacterium leguminum]|uniref:Trehalose 6-phosphate phosphatase n=1 Tax=Phyllobacterium leguminum TaxID=314237 RepID=A0A318TDA1_9HYPH|nr:trehalose-phosphatase [Phyllobacterium leguminum]PYE89206.1 trehalose 6-phosphatase [Phyllobacterium leguminum]
MTASLTDRAFPQALPGADMLGDWAVFLDIDGTLLDIAESPEAIRVPDGLSRDLAVLAEKLDGALVLVTGRSISFVDTIFPDTRFPVAGLHGAERRDAAGRVSRVEPTADFLRAKEELQKRAARWPHVIVEDKQAAIAVHYRQVPQFEKDMRRLMDEIAAIAGPGWTLQQGKMVVELRPAVHDKGHALETFMAIPPFVTRRPLAFGDDVTDEAMFKAANARGGFSVRIGQEQVQEKCEAAFRPDLRENVEEKPTAATFYLRSPAILRAWLRKIARETL